MKIWVPIPSGAFRSMVPARTTPLSGSLYIPKTSQGQVNQPLPPKPSVSKCDHESQLYKSPQACLRAFLLGLPKPLSAVDITKKERRSIIVKEF